MRRRLSQEEKDQNKQLIDDVNNLIKEQRAVFKKIPSQYGPSSMFDYWEYCKKNAGNTKMVEVARKMIRVYNYHIENYT